MNTKPKCIWTGIEDSRVKSVKLQTLDRFSIPTKKTFYVLPEHERELCDFNKRFVKHGRLYLILIISLTLFLPIVTLMGVISSFSSSIILITVGIITAFIGLVIVWFPFATPETAKWLGLRNTIVLARSTGLITIVLGITICFLPVF